MLSSLFRFRGPKATNFIRKNGRNVRHGAFSLRFAPSPQSQTRSRVAVVVSKKVNKRAVARNRIRRRVFEIIRKHWDNLSHPHDMTIGVFNKEVANTSHEILEQDLIELFKAAGLYKQSK